MNQHMADENKPTFLHRLQELASILDMREAFDRAPRCEARIRYPTPPGQMTEGEEHAGVLIEAWSTEPAATATRLYRYTQFYPQKNAFNEMEAIQSLLCTCDQDGNVCELKIAKEGGDTMLLQELESIFETDQATQQRYADHWIAESIETLGYLEAARSTRQTMTWTSDAEDLEEPANRPKEQMQHVLFQHIQQETGRTERE